MEASSTLATRRCQAPAGYALVILIVELIAAGYRAVARRFAAVAAAQRQAQLRRQLHGLNDHFLRDIGLQRDQIDRLFR